mmetsp:Transcript_60822/g.108006  ORF Transcript_60822/g.108006 Transcript_60822/m.108006 type:complete len:251 (+) Transcript_60822:756-1508(+)
MQVTVIPPYFTQLACKKMQVCCAKCPMPHFAACFHLSRLVVPMNSHWSYAHGFLRLAQCFFQAVLAQDVLHQATRHFQLVADHGQTKDASQVHLELVSSTSLHRIVPGIMWSWCNLVKQDRILLSGRIEELHSKDTCTGKGSYGFLGHFNGALPDLFWHQRRAQDSMADIVLLHRLHYRVCHEFTQLVASNHHSKLLLKGAPAFYVQVGSAQGLPCFVNLRGIFDGKITTAIIRILSCLQHERIAPISCA